MRFVENGPNIPGELLEQRDKGGVVFFCGAGVSVPAGLPNFADLARRVMRLLGTPSDARSRVLLERTSGATDLDQVFNLLQEEYRRGDVEEIVGQILRTPRKAKLEAHSLVLRLSRNSRRQPQIVTTNFDVLFERADKSLRVHIPPALPDLATVGSFDGIVYLHGRRGHGPSISRRQQAFILSSSDFGRAYLADGWATRFVRDLLDTYDIVLVGYSATDPPIRYLLEGLHARGSRSRSIYAFDVGDDNEVHDRWRSRGVRALPYRRGSDPGTDHFLLWESLRAWAHRADQPDAWRRSIVSVAQGNPSALAPYQRGQVAELLRTADGAALFAAADPAPTAEWLCVLDRQIRLGEPQSGWGREEPDPLLSYRLDDDPPRSSGAEAFAGDDLLSRTSDDERADGHARLAGVPARTAQVLPARLGHLVHWFQKVAGSPIALWWAAGYSTLHPQMLARIEWTCRHNRNALTGIAGHAWQLMLERFSGRPEHRRDWYDVITRLKNEGWTTQAFRDFDRAVQPRLSAKRAHGYRLLPPPEGSACKLAELIEFGVEFPGYERDSLDVPSEVLPRVFPSVRRALECASAFLAEIETGYWHTASFLDDGPSDDRYLNDASQFFDWARLLFDRLVADHPGIARHEVRGWAQDDRYFFDKFRIYAWMKSDLLPGPEVGHELLSLSDQGFWDEYHRRELLHALRSRWEEIPRLERVAIERRIALGRARWPSESDADYVERTTYDAAAMLGWLVRNGCQLSKGTSERLPALRASIPEWRVSWEEHADRSLDGRSGWVRTDSDPSALVVGPLSAVIPVAGSLTTQGRDEFTNIAPFEGLVAQHPRRAMAALSLEARKSNYPLHYWRTLLGRWPQEADVRLVLVCAARLSRAPDEVLVACRYDVTRWFTDNATGLASASRGAAFALLDRVMASLIAAGEQGTRSAIGDVTIGGKIQARSRRTYDHSINSPTGHLARGLFAILDGDGVRPSEGLPPDVRDRLEQLLLLPGDGGAYVVCESCVRLRWLFGIDPNWTRRRLIPFLEQSSAHAEPAWNGLLWDNHLAHGELFALIKPHFMHAFAHAATWQWESGSTFSRLVERLLVACYWRRHDRRYVTYDEARPLLRSCDDAGRAHAVWFLATAFAEDDWWTSFGRHFIRRAWPRETRFQTQAVSKQLASLAARAGDLFPDVVRSVIPLLIPVDELDSILHRAAEESDPVPLATRFPREMLGLLEALVPREPKHGPYGLVAILEAIAGASSELRHDPRWLRLNIIANST